MTDIDFHFCMNAVAYHRCILRTLHDHALALGLCSVQSFTLKESPVYFEIKLFVHFVCKSRLFVLRGRVFPCFKRCVARAAVGCECVG